MKRFGHYLGNIAGAVLALVMYSELEVLYFRPQRFDLGQYRVFVTALATVIVLFAISYIYRRQLKKKMIGALMKHHTGTGAESE